MHGDGPRYRPLKRAAIALLLVVLTCIAPRFRRLALPTFPADFNVYYTAAALVRQHQAAQIYAGADTGVDPQKAIAPASSPIFHAARAEGLTFVGLYVYPPILADLLVPFTLLPLPAATHLWLITNCVFLLITALTVIPLLGFRYLSWQAALIGIALACFTPALQCLVDGQITILLLLLWAAALRLAQKGQDLSSGALFALATAIKLTPAVVLLPLLIWRRWRSVAGFLTTLVLCTVLSLWINTPAAVHTYVTRVLPAMSGSIPYYTNYSLSAAVQRLLELAHTGSIPAFPATMPKAIVLAGRFASATALLVLLAVIAQKARRPSQQDQVFILGLLALAAPVLSPVSWFHAYSTAFVAFALLWRDCFQRAAGLAYLVTLTGVSLLLGSAVAEKLLPTLLFSGHALLSSLLQLVQLLAAVGLVAYRIARLGDTLTVLRGNADGPLAQAVP